MSQRLCPICRKPTDSVFAPFCSKRCADVDLNRWFKEGYSLPGDDAGDDDEPGERQGSAGQAGSGFL